MNIAILLGILNAMGLKVRREERAKPIRQTTLVPGLLVIFVLCFQYVLRPVAGEIQ